MTSLEAIYSISRSTPWTDKRVHTTFFTFAVVVPKTCKQCKIFNAGFLLTMTMHLISTQYSRCNAHIYFFRIYVGIVHNLGLWKFVYNCLIEKKFLSGIYNIHLRN